MLKIVVPEDCGNAPKKVFIRDFNIAFAENNNDKILGFMADDITWNLVGNKIVQGKEEVRKELETMELGEAVELILHTVVTHGNTAAADGIMQFKNTAIAFCDVYEFTGHEKNTKIKELTSYGIELK
jgi:hypothetical protein